MVSLIVVAVKMEINVIGDIERCFEEKYTSGQLISCGGAKGRNQKSLLRFQVWVTEEDEFRF